MTRKVYQLTLSKLNSYTVTVSVRRLLKLSIQTHSCITGALKPPVSNGQRQPSSSQQRRSFGNSVSELRSCRQNTKATTILLSVVAFFHVIYINDRGSTQIHCSTCAQGSCYLCLDVRCGLDIEQLAQCDPVVTALLRIFAVERFSQNCYLMFSKRVRFVNCRLRRKPTQLSILKPNRLLKC